MTSRPARCRLSGMVVPDVCNDAMTARSAGQNAWLRSQVGAVLDGSDFTSGRLAVVITADEDDRHHGNRVLDRRRAHPDLHHRVVTRRSPHYALSRLAAGSPASTLLGHARTARSLLGASGSPADISTEMRAVRSPTGSSTPDLRLVTKTAHLRVRWPWRGGRHGRTWGAIPGPPRSTTMGRPDRGTRRSPSGLGVWDLLTARPPASGVPTYQWSASVAFDDGISCRPAAWSQSRPCRQGRAARPWLMAPSVPSDKGANAGIEGGLWSAGMVLARTRSTMALLRHGGMTGSSPGLRALDAGSFLRAFTFGHVRQLDAVARGS